MIQWHGSLDKPPHVLVDEAGRQALMKYSHGPDKSPSLRVLDGVYVYVDTCPCHDRCPRCNAWLEDEGICWGEDCWWR